MTAALTPRQYAVAALYADGLSRREVAARLGCSVATVKRHLEDIAAIVTGPGTLRSRVTGYVRTLPRWEKSA